MRTVELPYLPNGEKRIEAIAASLGLEQSTKRTLASYPGSIHWHFKHKNERGTLEATHWPMGKRTWLAVHANREGDWIDSAIQGFQSRFTG
jgi:hypothetical protein